MDRQVCERTNNNVVAKEFSRMRNSKHSTSRNFIRLITCAYKKARQSKESVVRIQSPMCEVAYEKKSYLNLPYSIYYFQYGNFKFKLNDHIQQKNAARHCHCVKKKLV